MSDMINGKTLIEMGFEPAPWFGQAIAEINDKAMSRSQAHRHVQKIVDGIEAEKAAAEAARAAIVAKWQPLRDTPAPISVNIEAESEDEIVNVEAVRATMAELCRTPVIEEGAIMPDACPAGPMGTIPVGGVIAARNAILPGAHSADICCSMTATIVDGVSPAELLDAIHSVTHFGPGGRKRHEEFPLPKHLVEALQDNPFFDDRKLQGKARADFGTCGDGNHFNYLGRSEATGKTVLVTHFGSRGPGAMLYKKGMEVAERFRQEMSGDTLPDNAWIPADSQEGIDYWAALQIIREWTKQSHAALHDAAIAAIGGRAVAVDRHWNEHNFVFREEDANGALFWHAKGATPIHAPLLPDTTGTQIIPLNMAQPILFVEGERNDANRGFAPHGAGRNLSRTQHKKRLAGRTNEEVFAEETAGIDARFFCNRIDVSELPSAYKDAEAVQRQMSSFGLATVTDRILPHGAIMAGDWEFDAPWNVKRRARLAAEAAAADKS